jgi:hypothetical protein
MSLRFKQSPPPSPRPCCWCHRRHQPARRAQTPPQRRLATRPPRLPGHTKRSPAGRTSPANNATVLIVSVLTNLDGLGVSISLRSRLRYPWSSWFQSCDLRFTSRVDLTLRDGLFVAGLDGASTGPRLSASKQGNFLPNKVISFQTIDLHIADRWSVLYRGISSLTQEGHMKRVTLAVVLLLVIFSSPLRADTLRTFSLSGSTSEANVNGLVVIDTTTGQALYGYADLTLLPFGDTNQHPPLSEPIV